MNQSREHRATKCAKPGRAPISHISYRFPPGRPLRNGAVISASFTCRGSSSPAVGLKQRVWRRILLPRSGSCAKGLLKCPISSSLSIRPRKKPKRCERAYSNCRRNISSNSGMRSSPPNPPMVRSNCIRSSHSGIRCCFGQLLGLADRSAFPQSDSRRGFGGGGRRVGRRADGLRYQ